MKLPSPKTSSLEDDDLVKEEAIKVNEIKSLSNDVKDESLESNEIINVKISKSHPLENIIGLTCQELCDDFAKIMHDEFKMSMIEMLKKIGLEDFKPMKTPMSSDIKLTKDEEGESVDSTKNKGTTQLGLWYPKGSGIKTVVYADSDHARDYVDQKSTSGIYTFLGCCLTSWFLKKQTTLAISTIEVEYVKEYQEKDKIRSKPDKNGKRGEAEKSLKQLQ
nr:hypothetical protein [Tanacetum cinerariifolium]